MWMLANMGDRLAPNRPNKLECAADPTQPVASMGAPENPGKFVGYVILHQQTTPAPALLFQVAVGAVAITMPGACPSSDLESIKLDSLSTLPWLPSGTIMTEEPRRPG